MAVRIRKKARIFIKSINEKQAMMILARGQNGKGRSIYKCGFWLDSSESEKLAIQNCKEVAKKFGIDTLYVDSERSGNENKRNI